MAKLTNITLTQREYDILLDLLNSLSWMCDSPSRLINLENKKAIEVLIDKLGNSYGNKDL